METGLYERLKSCTTKEQVRTVCLAAFGLSFSPKQKFDGTEQVLYLFRRDRKFSAGQGIASAVAQALYILREFKYGEATCPVPPYVCAVCREEALLFETEPFSRFYARRKEEKYDWDRTPLSPCPVLVADLAADGALSRARVYPLTSPAGEAAFFAALAGARAVQMSMFEREKKTIDENNFLKVYEYWSSLFRDALVGKGEEGLLPEYFLADIESGRSVGSRGRVEFFLNGSRVTRSLPLYEYRYFWSIYEKVKDERTIFAIRRKLDRLSEEFARRFEGEFYTPVPFAVKAWEYLEKTIGKKKLESGAYRIWDMAAGSGNLEFPMPAAVLPYTYLSTLDEEDAAYCRRIFPSAEVFSYDYLNDDVELLAEKLRADDAAKAENSADPSSVQLSLLDGARSKKKAFFTVGEAGADEGEADESGRIGAAGADAPGIVSSSALFVESVRSVRSGQSGTEAAGPEVEGKGAKTAGTDGAGRGADGGAESGAPGAWKMPEKLRRDLANPRLKWLIFINPPFATGNSSSLTAGKASKNGVADTKMRELMTERGYGETSRELFSQFLFRIFAELGERKGYLGLFSTLKYLNAPNDRRLREGFFRASVERGFLFSSENFEGGTGKFPVSFVVWKLDGGKIGEADPVFDVFDKDAEKIGTKRIRTSGTPLSAWVERPPAKYVFPAFTGAVRVCEGHADVRDRVADGFLCSLMCCGNDMQHRNQTALFSGPQASAGAYSVTPANFEKSMAIHAVRRLARPDWTNNRDQFYAPVEEPDEDFFTDCAVWSAFADSNNTCSLRDVAYKGGIYRVRNQMFPFSQREADGWSGKAVSDPQEGESFLFAWLAERALSEEAKKTMRAARVFYAYCYGKGAEIWDAGYAQLKASVVQDERGREALNALKAAHRALGEKLLKRIYEYGFLNEDVVRFREGE